MKIDLMNFCHLINFILTILDIPILTFLSSVGVPEAQIDDLANFPQDGYGQSKFIADYVVCYVSELGLPEIIIGIIQISGSSITDHWNKKEIIPSLLRSSRNSRCCTRAFFCKSSPETMGLPALISCRKNRKWFPIDL